ncbi:hypothetical protein X777_16179 [Ooceraea biroi]|uniref:Uncharacterized protein n=1 Tax=Ooceraea biroi TaxID=2015173 RepID=A0A026WW78_OOCBI|nr:hypothetical protein X777_16179 [Ooceraea biroi]
MIFAEVASRVGLLGKVNLPREPSERARSTKRERGGGREREKEKSNALARVMGKRGREKEKEREKLDYQHRLEKSYKITTLHFSFRVTPTPGRVQRSTSTVTRDAAYLRETFAIASVRRNLRHPVLRNALAAKFYHEEIAS